MSRVQSTPITPAPWPQADLGHALRWTLRRAWSWLLPAGLLLAWWAGAHYEWVASQVLPGPDVVFGTFMDMLASGQLLSNAIISLERVLIGFLLGGALGLSLGLAMGLSERANEYLYPLVRLIGYVPLLGWLPLLMLLLGIGESLKIALVAQAALLPVALNTCNAVRAVPAQLIEVGRTYGFNSRQQIGRIIVPAAFPAIWSGIRYALTKSWLALVVVELLASSEGLGFVMVDSRQLYQMDVMLVAVASIGLIGFALDLGLAFIERRVLRWRPAAFA